MESPANDKKTVIKTNNNGETLELKQNNDAFKCFFFNKVSNRY